MEDPFELDQHSLDGKLKLLQEQFDRWRRIKSGAGELATQEELADAEDEFNWLTNELRKSAKSIGWDLDDLAETLRRMSEARQASGEKPHQGEPARNQYIRNSRDFLVAIETEVRTAGAKVADARDDGDQPTPTRRSGVALADQQLVGEAGSMSASTERLVESLLQQDEDDDDDDVDLLIREESGRLTRARFGVQTAGEVAGAREPALRRVWRRHRPALAFAGLVLLLLLIILIVSVSSRGRLPTTTATPAGL